MMQIARLTVFALFVVAILGSAADAADPVFPTGVRVGLVPLGGLQKAQAFIGFESNDSGVKVLVTELPPAAYSEVEMAVKADAASATGIKPEPIDTAAGKGFYTFENAKVGPDDVRRYSMVVPGGAFSGYIAVQVAAGSSTTYSDDAVRMMLATATVRKEVPIDEQLGMLPFKVTELSAFKTVRTLAPGAAILVGDADDETKIETEPFMIIGAISSAPEKPEDRSRFAQQAAAQIPGLRDGRITSSEPLRIDGSPGYETRIDAVSGANSTPVTVVQWLRFSGGSGALRIIASAPREQWQPAFTRFRAVRDGIESR